MKKYSNYLVYNFSDLFSALIYVHIHKHIYVQSSSHKLIPFQCRHIHIPIDGRLAMINVLIDVFSLQIHLQLTVYFLNVIVIYE